MSITHLTDPIDVYSEWIDETEKINSADANGQYTHIERAGTDVDDNNELIESTNKRIQSRKAHNKTSIGYKKDEFIASEDDEDELGVDED